MKVSQILTTLFGVYPSPTCSANYNDLTLEEHIHEFNLWLERKLAQLEVTTETVIAGRLGPARVVFTSDNNTSNNLLNISKDLLTVQSQSAFSTAKANCCVFKGKWMYEVQLRSKGVMQIGWCSSKCTFTQDTGVGDTKNSYGFDGSKQRLWHINTKKYGPFWRSGDIFGICLNMDDGKIEYYRNGAGLGDAFTSVERGPGIALFPAVSLAFDDSLTANFGGSPFRHPVEGYQPLQPHPKQMISKADFLLHHLTNMSRVISSPKPLANKSRNAPSTEAIYMILASAIIEQLESFMGNNYVIEDKVLSYIKSMCVIRSDIDSNTVIYPGMNGSTLGTFLSLLWTFMDVGAVKGFLDKMVDFLSSMYRETPLDLEYEKQRFVIVILTCICNHPLSRKYFLEYKFFNRNLLPIFLYIKPPDELTLADVLPDKHIWTEGLGGPKDVYLSDCNKLRTSTDMLYVLHRNLVERLMDNSDQTDGTPSSRKIFVTKLRQYVMENSLEHRAIFFMEGHYTSPTQPAVALSFLCILLDIVKSMFESECCDRKPFVDPSNFYNGCLNYYHFDRVGGVLSYLKRHFHAELVEKLGKHYWYIQPDKNEADRGNAPNLNDLYSTMFLFSSGSRPSFVRSSNRSPTALPEMNGIHSECRSSNFDEQFEIQPGSVEEYHSLTNILDCCILYYYAVAHKYIIMVADLRDSIGILSEILKETRLTHEDVRKSIAVMSKDSTLSSVYDEILKNLNESVENREIVFTKRSLELARKQAWYRSVALAKQRRDSLCWMLGSIFNTLQDASNEGGLFAFVPEFYMNIIPILLDTVMDFSFHDLSIQNDLSDTADTICLAAEFLSSQASNPRVVLASCKDALLQALGTLTCHEAGILALEQCAMSSKAALIHALMRPYQNRAWGQSNWLLLRFWMGDGFAYRDARPPSVWQDGSKPPTLGLARSRGKQGSHAGLLHHIAPPYPSKHFQQLISQILLDDEPFATTLVNSILSQLNWAFSEFILLLQEIQNGAQRQEQQSITVQESRQSKICSMCFDLTVSLLRVLEMLISIAPQVFTDANRANSEILLSRVCQLLSQVLSRVTVPPGCFQFVVDMCLPDLSTVIHFPIISATIAVLLALLKDELMPKCDVNKIPRISRMLLIDPSFQIASLEFAVDAVRTPIGQTADGASPNEASANATADKGLNPQRTNTDMSIIKFRLQDYRGHINQSEIDRVKELINILLSRQYLLSDVVVPSEDTLCTICYSQSISATFEPCKHQSCCGCITQHLMNSKLCFYCKATITSVINFDGNVVFEQVASRADPIAAMTAATIAPTGDIAHTQ